MWRKPWTVIRHTPVERNGIAIISRSDGPRPGLTLDGIEKVHNASKPARACKRSRSICRSRSLLLTGVDEDVDESLADVQSK